MIKDLTGDYHKDLNVLLEHLEQATKHFKKGIEAAYKEGWSDGHCSDDSFAIEESWHESKSKEALE